MTQIDKMFAEVWQVFAGGNGMWVVFAIGVLV
jgi:hypothetical protein